MTLEKEFQYSDKNFQFLKKKVKQFAGINLADSKNELVYSRISRLLRLHHFTTFDEYCERLKQNDEQIVKEFVNAITTNYTIFMREPYHFEYLSSVLLPYLKKLNAASKKLRIWSAGCSTGEEAYSISFIVNDVFADVDWDIKILATDVDSDALSTAKEALYPYDVIKEIPLRFKMKLENYFDVAKGNDTTFVVKDKFRIIVHFKQFNFMNKIWPMHGPFDIIFCRNVMIYFERSMQENLIKNFISLLKDKDGYLFLGPSEAFLRPLWPLKCIQGTIFRKEL